MQILIADDAPDIRLCLQKQIERLGHEPILVNNGAEAWEYIQESPVRFLLSDWQMPKMDGLELCRKIRNADLPNYVYIMLLTAMGDAESVIEGLEQGADDFIAKPFDMGILKARISAGERIISLQRELDKKNKHLEKAYQNIRRDIQAAVEVQQNLLPPSSVLLDNIVFDWLYIPCAFVAGDTLNYFKLDENHIGFYHLDVAGHGIPSAFMSVTLHRYMSPNPSESSPLKRTIATPPYYEVIEPAGRVIQALNQQFVQENDSMQYFTMVYGVLNRKDGCLSLCQAGHPNPIYIPKDKPARYIGDGGFPVAMLPDMEFDSLSLQISQDEKLIFYSDGITECANPDGEFYGEERLLAFVEENRKLSPKEVLQKLKETLSAWKGDDKFQDDVSVLSLQYAGIN